MQSSPVIPTPERQRRCGESDPARRTFRFIFWPLPQVQTPRDDPPGPETVFNRSKTPVSQRLALALPAAVAVEPGIDLMRVKDVQGRGAAAAALDGVISAAL